MARRLSWGVQPHAKSKHPRPVDGSCKDSIFLRSPNSAPSDFTHFLFCPSANECSPDLFRQTEITFPPQNCEIPVEGWDFFLPSHRNQSLGVFDLELLRRFGNGRLSPQRCQEGSPWRGQGRYPSGGTALLDFAVGAYRAALISVLSLSMIAAGVFLGAPMPNQVLVSKPGTKSDMIGTSGNASERRAVHRQRAPALMCPIDSGKTSNMTCTWPASKSASARG